MHWTISITAHCIRVCACREQREDDGQMSALRRVVKRCISRFIRCARERSLAGQLGLNRREVPGVCGRYDGLRSRCERESMRESSAQQVSKFDGKLPLPRAHPLKLAQAAKKK